VLRSVGAKSLGGAGRRSSVWTMFGSGRVVNRARTAATEGTAEA
jgi:hypothetical protein